MWLQSVRHAGSQKQPAEPSGYQQAGAGDGSLGPEHMPDPAGLSGMAEPADMGGSAHDWHDDDDDHGDVMMGTDDCVLADAPAFPPGKQMCMP